MTKTIYLTKCDDGNIWVRSDEDPIGTESKFVKYQNEDEQFMIALADFLGFKPHEFLNLESND